MEKAALKRKLNARAQSEVKHYAENRMAGEYHTTDARSGEKAPVPKIESYGDYLSNGYLDKMTAMGQQHEWKLSKNHARYQKAKLYPRSGANSVLHSVRNVNS